MEKAKCIKGSDFYLVIKKKEIILGTWSGTVRISITGTVKDIQVDSASGSLLTVKDCED